jgi:DNA-binding HxlR family transcriptional regulator
LQIETKASNLLRQMTSQIGTASCSIAATLAVIGDRWTVLVLRDIFRGVHRFSELQDDLGIARNLLSARLAKLVAAGVLEKVPYQDRPVRYEYRLTDKGRDLSPSLIALMGWGDRWMSNGQPPTVLIHDQCGTPLEQRVECPTCDQDINPRAIRSRPGPGRRTNP